MSSRATMNRLRRSPKPLRGFARKLHGNEHNTTLRALNDFGLMQIHSGDLEGAEKALRETADMTTAMFGADADNGWTTRSNLIRVLELKGRYREALAEQETFLSSEEQLVADTRPDRSHSRRTSSASTIASSASSTRPRRRCAVRWRCGSRCRATTPSRRARRQ